jgi:hypothetical protein
VPPTLGELGCIVNLAGNPLLHHGEDVPAGERKALVELFQVYKYIYTYIHIYLYTHILIYTYLYQYLHLPVGHAGGRLAHQDELVHGRAGGQVVQGGRAVQPRTQHRDEVVDCVSVCLCLCLHLTVPISANSIVMRWVTVTVTVCDCDCDCSHLSVSDCASVSLCLCMTVSLTISPSASASISFSVRSTNGMEGRISSSVSKLTSLRMIELATMPGLVGSLPRALCGLSTLRRLCICRCGLTGRIPSEIGSLVGLEELQLFGNQLSGSIPRCV